MIPALSVLIGGGLAILDVAFVEEHVNLPSSWEYSAGTATTVLAAVVSAMVGLTGIVVAVAVLIIQMATGTLSPRYMRIWYRDPLQKAVLAGFLGTLGFAYALLRNIDDRVPHLGVTLTGLSVIVSMVLFLKYIDRFAHLLRPVGLAAYVSEAGASVIGSFWKGLQGAGLATGAAPGRSSDGTEVDGQPALTVKSVQSGVVQAVDHNGLVALARHHDSMLVLHCHIGDFVPEGDTMLEVHASGSAPPEQLVRQAFVFGVERAFEQDPAFALRIIVDIAIRALSPGINDPTTGVQLLDYVERLLRLLGERELADRYELRDESGRPRIFFSARSWDDFLALGITEIREYGSTSTQVTRRLYALLDGLMRSVHPANREAVGDQLARLDASLEEDVPNRARRDYASRPDRQGIGGPERLNGGMASAPAEPLPG